MTFFLVYGWTRLRQDCKEALQSWWEAGRLSLHFREETILTDLSPSTQKGCTSYIFFNAYLFLRKAETDCERGRGREREGDAESEARSRLRAVSTGPDAGLELTNREIMT